MVAVVDPGKEPAGGDADLLEGEVVGAPGEVDGLGAQSTLLEVAEQSLRERTLETPALPPRVPSMSKLR